ncbi:MAG: stage II sporulation protein P [Clostridia bacterium]
MISVKIANKKKIALLSILIIVVFYLFSHVLVITNKINFYINKQFILEEIGSFGLVEGDFLKSHIESVLPVINVLKGKPGSRLEDDKDIRWFIQFITGFDIKKPVTIISSQILLVKKYEDSMIHALGPDRESAVWNPSDRKEVQEADASNIDGYGSSVPTGVERYDNNDSEDFAEDDIKEINYNPSNISGAEFAEGIYVKNEAKKSINISQLLEEDLKTNITGTGPHVLIIHTHTSEAYTPTKNNNYTPSDPDRTEDSRYNVVRVGEEIANNLKSMGVSVIHDKTVHDYPSYNGSYSAALKTVEKQLKRNPSIKLVLDIHRDALIFDDGKKLKVTAEVGSEKVAQVMIVAGTDLGGLSHPNWKENFKLALKVQKKMCDLYSGLARPVYLVPYRYNQHTTPGSLIIEVGANGNTLEEAMASGKYIAKSVAEVMKEIKK